MLFLALLLTATGCRDEQRSRDAAIERAIVYYQQRLARVDAGEAIHPHMLMFLDIFYRRFGVEEFADVPQRYDQCLAVAMAQPNQPQDTASIRVFRRVLDNENQAEPEDFNSLHNVFDFLTGHALYCDRQPLPENYAETFRQAVEAGGYSLTHAALALMMAEDLGCDGLATPELRERIVARMADIPNTDGNVSDLELEAAAFLCYMGHREEVSDSFLSKVIEAQRPDGGWSWNSEDPKERADFHATGMALWLLLEVQRGPRAADTLVPQP